MAAGGQQLAFDIAYDKAVLVLRRDVGGQPARVRNTERLGQLPGSKVTASDVAYLSRANQVSERLERFLLGRLGVGSVQLIEIDVVGVQAAQTILCRRDHVA